MMHLLSVAVLIMNLELREATVPCYLICILPTDNLMKFHMARDSNLIPPIGAYYMWTAHVYMHHLGGGGWR